MSSPKSPYRELGISFRAQQTRRPRRPRYDGLATSKEVMKTGHLWEDNNSRIRCQGRGMTKAMRAGMRVCRRCGQAEFAVGSLRCRGKKGNTCNGHH